jgi:hypothetical protein
LTFLPTIGSTLLHFHQDTSFYFCNRRLIHEFLKNACDSFKERGRSIKEATKFD